MAVSVTPPMLVMKKSSNTESNVPSKGKFFDDAASESAVVAVGPGVGFAPPFRPLHL